MASCTRIDMLLQAYVDEELSPSDRVILEQHVSACHPCASMLRRQKRLSAELFECFAEKRLDRDLRGPVLENLPGMELPSVDLAGVNWRAKHSVSGWAAVARYLPAAAIAVVAVLGFMINYYWPRPAGTNPTLGIVTQTAGHATRVTKDSTTWTGVFVEELVAPGDRFETGPKGTLMLGLKGPTQVKLNENTRLKIDDARRVSLEQGEVWLDIGRDGHLFKVTTPEGNITVFGTSFAVRVFDGVTTVAVERGEVLVGNETSFTNISQGQQVSLGRGKEIIGPVALGIDSIAPWSRAIAADAGADAIFHRLVVSPSDQAELAANEVFRIDATKDGRRWTFTAINVYWQPDDYRARRCSYDVYVYDDQMRPLFKERIPGTAFLNKEVSSIELPVPGSPIQNVRALMVRLIPDYLSGDLEATGLSVSAIAQRTPL